MRVGIDARPLLFSRTGIGRYVAELVRALGALGVGGDLLLYGDSWRPVEDAERVAGLIEQSGAALRRRRMPGRLARLLGRLGRGVDLRLGGVDVFHHTDLVFPPVTRARTVVTVQDVVFDIDPSFHEQGFRRAVAPRLRAALAAASAVIVPSRETRDQVAARYSVPEERLFLVPHGAEHVLAPGAAAAHEVERLLERAKVARPYILSVGTIEPRKNHLRLLAAFQRASNALPHTLVLAGGFGWLCAEARARIAALRRGGRVVHFADLEDRFLPGLYQGADFTVYPSLYEGFGLPVLESLALGVPVVTTRRGALPEVGGDAAVYADAEDEADLAETMRRVATDADLRLRLAEEGKKQAAAFSWRRSAEAHAAVYRDVAGG
ncbi:MAG: glycosyltransferase family 4 protein [Planctomycetes bacterium]|nr:glycosyltransferase family 4 protein [Planctomycetota bacterium]